MYVFNQYMPLDKQQEADWLAVLDQTYGNYIRTNNPNEKRQLIDQFYFNMIDIAKQALQVKKDMDK